MAYSILDYFDLVNDMHNDDNVSNSPSRLVRDQATSSTCSTTEVNHAYKEKCSFNISSPCHPSREPLYADHWHTQRGIPL